MTGKQSAVRCVFCREAFKMGIKSKGDLKKYSLADLEENGTV